MSSDLPPPESPESPGDAGAGRPEPAPAADEPARARTSFPYGRSGAVELGASGFRAPRWPGRGEAFVAYRDVTHVAIEPRALAVGTLHGVLLLSRSQLGGAEPARALAQALRERIFALPDGDAHRARFERLDERMRVRRPWVAALLVALTALVHALQLLVPGFYEAAIYRPGLLALGEWWRYATTQFLHVNLGHLGVNAAAALIAGAFVERSIGRAGTLFVAAAAGCGAMIASRFGDYAELLGFSGVAAGFFGALIAIELAAPAQAPASARVPRTILLAVVALQAALDLLPQLAPGWAAHTAGLAHLGGFAAGALAALLARDALRGLVLAGTAAGAVATLASFGVVARNLFAPGPALERQAERMLAGQLVNPGELNNLAWQIATAKAPSARALELAERLAELAVQVTRGQEPTLLDTLAEVYFARGRTDDALHVIDRAIALAPGELYYEEQRRRFTGERAAGDRPEPPAEEPPERPEQGEEERGEPDFDQAPPSRIPLPPGDEITV
jgi:membrane associated rhomboid family serine protease